MKKSFNYFRANPGGNITGFVVWPVYPGYRKAYTDCIREQIDETVEQVAFVSPAYEGAPLRMDMMGGEFCANATRAYGLYSASFHDVKGPVDIEVYVSGKEGTTDVIADVDKKTAYVAMQEPESIEEIELEGKKYKLVNLPGISHVVIDDRKEDEDFVIRAIKAIKADHKADAYGVVFFDKKNSSMIPYVYVPKTETLVRESSCGSGTAAVLNTLNPDINNLSEDYKIVIKQPGGELEVFVYDLEDGRKYMIGGPVELGEVEKITIDIPTEVVKKVTEEHNKDLERRKAAGEDIEGI